MPERRKSALASALLPLMTTKLPEDLTLSRAVGLQLADEDVVEGDVERARIFDQAVIRDDRTPAARALVTAGLMAVRPGPG
jgi:hypothetical protein